MRTLPPKIIVWYDRALKLWTATYNDDLGNQQYNAGYGPTKQEAIKDVKYQASIQKEKSIRR